MVLSVDYHTLIKLLREEKRCGAKKFIVAFPCKPWTLLGLNKRFFNTGHFPFWGGFTEAAVTIVYVDRFNCNLTV